MPPSPHRMGTRVVWGEGVVWRTSKGRKEATRRANEGRKGSTWLSDGGREQPRGGPPAARKTRAAVS
jgi:hypothetical protein